MPDNESTGKDSITVWVPASLKARVKAEAGSRKISMAKLVADALERELAA